MNRFTNSCSVLCRLGRLLPHRYKPTHPPLTTARYTHHVHAAARGSRPSDVWGSIRGLFSRPTLLPHSRLPTPSRRWYRDPRMFAAAAVLLPCAAPFALVYAFSEHETVPYTNRSHLVILSPSKEREFGNLSFDNIKKKLGDKILDPSDPRTVRVRLILADIIRGAHRAFPARRRSDGDMWVNESRNQGDAAVQPQTEHLGDLNWEVIVVKDDSINAYSRLGGKIVIHTGFLDKFKTDAEIAAVLAHEVGHVVARHFTDFTLMLAWLTPTLYSLLPFSQREEIEADRIGLMLLAAAGFDPRIAAGACEQMAEIRRDSAAAWHDYIGSHPSCKKRLRLLSQGKTIEEALELYYKQLCAGEGADRHFPHGGRFWETLN